MAGKSSKTSKQEGFYAALDAGSSKVLCVVATPGAEPGSYRVIGFGNTPSEGIRNGTVIDVAAAVSAIRNAVLEAQYTANLPGISRIWTAIGGQTLKSSNCTGVTVLRGREVTQDDVEQAELNARQHAFREGGGRDLLKLIPQGFACGDVVTPRSPVGLIGQKLEVHMHAVYGSTSNAENLKRCMQRAGLELINYEPHPWACAQGVLSETEKTCGAAVIDLGAETTSLIVIEEGAVRLTDVRPWGAELLTRDLAIVLGLDLDEAEELKLSAGSCDLSKVVKGELVEVHAPGRRPRPVKRELLVKTLRSRMLELFRLYRELLAKSGELDRVKIVVLSGGGAQLRGAAELAEQVFERKVRIGRPRGIEGETPLLQRPDAAVALGLIRCADEARTLGLDAAYAVKPVPSFFGRLKTIFVGDY